MRKAVLSLLLCLWIILVITSNLIKDGSDLLFFQLDKSFWKVSAVTSSISISLTLQYSFISEFLWDNFNAKTFNDLDVNENTSSLVTNVKGDLLQWRDLFYVYNLLVNNERYGDKSLTPLFQDYLKESDSLGYNYVMFSAKLDSGELDVFNVSVSHNNLR